MSRRIALLVAAVAAFAGASPALATTTYVVDPAAQGSGCDTDHVCPTLGAAVAAVNAGSGSGDVIEVKPGVYPEAVSISAASVTITRFAVPTGTVTVTGGDAQNPTLLFRGQGPYRVAGLQVVPAGAKANAVELRGLPGGPTAPTITQQLTLEDDVLSGAGQSQYGLSVTTNSGGSAANVDIRHATIADRDFADAMSLNTLAFGSRPLTVHVHNSIVSGGIAIFATSLYAPEADAHVRPQVEMVNDDTSTSREALFVDPLAENFHLLASAPNVIGTGGTAESGEPATDIDGDPRPATGAWDKGADQFVNRGAPSAPTLSSDTASPTSAAPVGLTASGATDPDAGDVFSYKWNFGDGSAEATTPGASTTHAFAKGTYEVTARAIDLAGHEGPASAPFELVVTDPPPAPAGSGGSGGTSGSSGTPPGASPSSDRADGAPRIAIVTPRLDQALHGTTTVRIRRRGHVVRARVRVPLTLSGTVAAPRGVSGVALALARLNGSACQYYTGGRGLSPRACGDPQFFAATTSGRSWSATVPPRALLPAGSYLLIARATDTSGAASSTFVRFVIR